MDRILEQITDWLREMLVAGIMDNVTGTFDNVNTQVAQITAEVGTTPANFVPAIFNMIWF